MSSREVASRSPDSFNARIRRPKEKIVSIGNDVDYVFIFRKDIDFTISPIADRMVRDYSLDPIETERAIKEEYDIFFERFLDIVQWGHSSKGEFEIHLYNPDELEEKIRERTENSTLVSLDPLIKRDMYELKLSREYFFGGRTFIQRVARPGELTFDHQISEIPKEGIGVSIVDDDLFKGGSMIEAVDRLENKGLLVNKIIPGIKVGSDPERITQKHIPIDPVVEYRSENGDPVLTRVNIADPRDYLFGGSGLVVKLPNGDNGRAPYFLPFLPTSDKTGIPKELDRSFALHVMQANAIFFDRVKKSTGHSLLLRHMDPHFVILMNTVFGFDSNVPMEQIVNWAMNNIDRVWQVTTLIESLELVKSTKDAFPSKLNTILAQIPGQTSDVEELMGGEVNTTFLIHHNEEEEILLIANNSPRADLQRLSPYFHPDKLSKNLIVADISNRFKIPIPKILTHSQDAPMSWMLIEKANGVNLENLFDSLSPKRKVKVIQKLAKTLSDIHTIPLSELEQISPLLGVEADQGENVFQTISILLNLNVISQGFAEQARDWYMKHSLVLPSPTKSLVHRDYYQRNVFVDPVTLDVTGIIDWTDTAHIGDPVKDALLAAKWIAGNMNQEEGRIFFYTFLTEYNKTAKQSINLEDARANLAIYNFQWYFEAALFTLYRGDNVQVKKQLKRVADMLKS